MRTPKRYVYKARVLGVSNANTLYLLIYLGLGRTVTRRMSFRGILPRANTLAIQALEELLLDQTVTVETVKIGGEYFVNVWTPGMADDICINDWMVEHGYSRRF